MPRRPRSLGCDWCLRCAWPTETRSHRPVVASQGTRRSVSGLLDGDFGPLRLPGDRLAPGRAATRHQGGRLRGRRGSRPPRQRFHLERVGPAWAPWSGLFDNDFIWIVSGLFDFLAGGWHPGRQRLGNGEVFLEDGEVFGLFDGDFIWNGSDRCELRYLSMCAHACLRFLV